jgi:hypothetical protein
MDEGPPAPQGRDVRSVSSSHSAELAPPRQPDRRCPAPARIWNRSAPGHHRNQPPGRGKAGGSHLPSSPTRAGPPPEAPPPAPGDGGHGPAHSGKPPPSPARSVSPGEHPDQIPKPPPPGGVQHHTRAGCLADPSTSVAAAIVPGDPSGSSINSSSTPFSRLNDRAATSRPDNGCVRDVTRT